MLEGGHIHYLDDGCFMDIHICQSLLNCVFMCILLYVNYTSIKLSKNKKKKKNKMMCLMELCSMLCGRLDGRRVWGRMDTCTCMAESLCCSPETITTLLIGCTPIQNKKVF